jgi:hypothetical protein
VNFNIFRHREETSQSDSSTDYRVEKVSTGEQKQLNRDEVTEKLRQVFSRGISRNLENQMIEALKQFRGKLEQHPYVLSQSQQKSRLVVRLRAIKYAFAAAALSVVLGVGYWSGIFSDQVSHSLHANVEMLTVRPGKSVGKVAIGFSKDQVEQALGSRFTVASSGAYDFPGSGLRVIFNSSNAVERIAASGNSAGQIATAEGIRIGSSESDLLSKYGEPALARAETGGWLEYPHRGVRFSLESNTPGAPATVQAIEVFAPR